MGFDMSYPGAIKDLHGDHPYIAQEDEYAETVGKLVLGLVKARMMRQAWVLFGWPGRLVLLCDPDVAVQTAVIDEFRKVVR